MAGEGYGAFDDHAAWNTPLGNLSVAMDLQGEILKTARFLRVDSRMHSREHSIEVNLPLLQHAWPGVRILPIEVPPMARAKDVGAEVARALKTLAPGAVYFASSDLTHYGVDYGVAPAGVGEPALQWATNNDRELLAEVAAMHVDASLLHTQRHHSACGGGAIAALLSAAAELGATNSEILLHTNSCEVLKKTYGQDRAEHFVGYAAVGVA